MSIFKHLFYTLIFLSLLFTSFTYSQTTGAVKKAGGIGLTIQGVKTSKEGLKQLTKYGQELVTQNNQTEQNTQTNQISQTKQQNSNNILDNLASLTSNNIDKLKSNLDKNTKPLQNTADNIGRVFAKVKDSISDNDKSEEQSSEVVSATSNGKNNNNSNNQNNNDIDEQTSEKIDDIVKYAKTHKGSSRSGYNGGSNYKNKEQLLPKKDAKGRSITYREYDVNPKKSGIGRDGERVVIGSNDKVYYTKDHYKTFIEVK
jgi:ribonuclease T1